MVQKFQLIKLCKNNGVKTAHPSTHISISYLFQKKPHFDVNKFQGGYFLANVISPNFSPDLPWFFRKFLSYLGEVRNHPGHPTPQKKQDLLKFIPVFVRFPSFSFGNVMFFSETTGENYRNSATG